MVLYTLVSGLSAGLVDRNVARMLSRMNKFKNINLKTLVEVKKKITKQKTLRQLIWHNKLNK